MTTDDAFFVWKNSAGKWHVFHDLASTVPTLDDEGLSDLTSGMGEYETQFDAVLAAQTLSRETPTEYGVWLLGVYGETPATK